MSLGFNGSGTLDSQNNVYVKAVYNDFGHVVDNNEYFDPPENLTSFDVIAPYTGTHYVEVKARDGQTGSQDLGQLTMAMLWLTWPSQGAGYDRYIQQRHANHSNDTVTFTITNRTIYLSTMYWGVKEQRNDHRK